MAEESLKHKTKKGIYWTFFNQFSNDGLSFFVGIIMARILSPSDYGITALPSVFLAIAGVLVHSGFGSALIRKPKVTEEDLSTAFYYSWAVGITCYLSLFITAPYIASFFDTPILVSLIRITALTFLWGPLSTPQTVIMRRRLDFKTPARISVVTNIVGAIVGVSCAYLGYGLWSLVAMNVVSSFMGTILRWLAVKWLPKAPFSKESFKYLWNFGNKMMASAFLDQGYKNIAPLLIGKYFSPADLGVYNRAKGYAALPSAQITSMVQTVTFPVLSKMQQDDETLARSYRKMMRVTAFVVFPVMLILSALARPVIILLVTEKWEASIILLKIMCFSLMWYPIHAMNLNLLQVKGRSDLFLRLEIVKKIVSLTILCVALPFGLVAFVSANILGSMISLFINTYYTGKLIHVTYLMQMKDLLPIFILSFTTWVLITVFIQFVDNLWLQLILGSAIGAIVYIALSLIFKFEELKDVKYMFKRNV